MNKILHGNSLEVLKTLEDASVECVVTSPPYWGLRDYGVDGQLGHEKTPDEYVENLCRIFDEVWRVLKPEGTCFVNLGDTYGTQSGAMRDGKFGAKNTNNQQLAQPKSIHKCLLMIPARFALAMISRGWILRNEIIWHKPNAMPSSAKDRFTVDYEVIYFFVKQREYYFEQQHDPYASSSDARYRQALRAGRSYAGKFAGENAESVASPRARYKRGTGSVASRGNDADGLVVGGFNEKGRNKRCVWSIPTKPLLEAHFATFPEALIETPIKAGCPHWGVVLDPFMGSGTTCCVARRLGRNYIGIELNPEYIKIAEKRLAQQTLLHSLK